MKKLNLKATEKEMLYGIVSGAQNLSLASLEIVEKIFTCLKDGAKKTVLPIKKGQNTPDTVIKFAEGKVELEDAEFTFLKSVFDNFKLWRGSNAIIAIPLRKKLEE